MRAVVYGRYGGPEVLSVRDVPAPTPASDEVLVRVVSSSLNDWDEKLMTGDPWVNRVGSWRVPQHPTLGSDVAGRVEVVGTDVTRWQPGDDVVGDLSSDGFGAFAEYAVGRESAWVARPAELTWVQSGALMQAGTLAAAALRSTRGVKPGSEVLVNGAGGGVGTFVVQMAAALGARVTGVDTAAKLDVVRSAGASTVVDYTAEDVAAHGARYDVIVDIACHRSVRDYRRMLAPGGSVAVTGGSLPHVFAAMVLGPTTSLVRRTRISVPLWQANRARDVEYLLGAVRAGVRPVIDQVVSLDDTAEAMRCFHQSRHRGKVAIRVDTDPDDPGGPGAAS